MNEEELNQNTNSESGNVGDAVDPLTALKELKANTVSKQEYDEVVAEKNRYFKALANGEGYSQQEVPKKPVDVDGLRKDLFSKDMTNLEFVSKALELRDEIIETEHYDIFVGKPDTKWAPKTEDYETAQRVADVYRNCIDVANGDPEVFNRELSRATTETALPTRGINPNIRR